MALSNGSVFFLLIGLTKSRSFCILPSALALIDDYLERPNGGPSADG